MYSALTAVVGKTSLPAVMKREPLVPVTPAGNGGLCCSVSSVEPLSIPSCTICFECCCRRIVDSNPYIPQRARTKFACARLVIQARIASDTGACSGRECCVADFLPDCRFEPCCSVSVLSLAASCIPRTPLVSCPSELRKRSATGEGGTCWESFLCPNDLGVVGVWC